MAELAQLARRDGEDAGIVSDGYLGRTYSRRPVISNSQLPLSKSLIGISPRISPMIPYLIGLLMFSPTNHLIVFNRQDLQIFIDGTRILLVLISAVLALKLNLSLVITVWLMSISSLIGHVLLFLLQLTLQNRLADRISPGG